VDIFKEIPVAMAENIQPDERETKVRVIRPTVD